MVPIFDELVIRTLIFVKGCFFSESKLTKFVTDYALSVGREKSPTGSNVLFGCNYFGFPYLNLGNIKKEDIYDMHASQSGDIYIRSLLLLELSAMKQHVFGFSSNIFNTQDIDTFSNWLCSY